MLEHWSRSHTLSSLKDCNVQIFTPLKPERDWKTLCLQTNVSIRWLQSPTQKYCRDLLIYRALDFKMVSKCYYPKFWHQSRSRKGKVIQVVIRTWATVQVRQWVNCGEENTINSCLVFPVLCCGLLFWCLVLFPLFLCSHFLCLVSVCLVSSIVFFVCYHGYSLLSPAPCYLVHLIPCVSSVLCLYGCYVRSYVYLVFGILCL